MSNDNNHIFKLKKISFFIFISQFFITLFIITFERMKIHFTFNFQKFISLEENKLIENLN